MALEGQEEELLLRQQSDKVGLKITRENISGKPLPRSHMKIKCQKEEGYSD